MPVPVTTGVYPEERRRIKGQPLLDAIGEDIFAIFKMDDGTFDVAEMCDMFTTRNFTADQLEQLGREIIAVARQSNTVTPHVPRETSA